MQILYKNARIYDSKSKSFFGGAILVSLGRIAEIFKNAQPDNLTDTCVVDVDGSYIVPGLVDAHTHGRAGADFLSADLSDIHKMSESYLEGGVTSIMPTLASAEIADINSAIERICEAKGNGDSNIVGIHLEGRYLNPQKRGAHAQRLLAPLNNDEIKNLIFKMKRAGAVHISAALELDSDGSFTREVLQNGATLALAHTNANFAEAKLAIERGADALTHTYNTMPPLHHRDGGAVAEGLTDEKVYCEIIADGFHVSPEMVKLAYICKREKTVLVTDSMEATGMPDGEYSIAGLPVTVKDGRARTHEGAIAGSTLSLLDGVKNLSRFADISFGEALYCATAAPSKMLRIDGDYGSIEVGKVANMLSLDSEYNINNVIFCGEIVK